MAESGAFSKAKSDRVWVWSGGFSTQVIGWAAVTSADKLAADSKQNGGPPFLDAGRVEESRQFTVRPSQNRARAFRVYSIRRAIPRLRRLAEDDEFGVMARCRCLPGPERPAIQRRQRRQRRAMPQLVTLKRFASTAQNAGSAPRQRLAAPRLRRQPVSTCRSYRF
jgi:hypothetical protein